MIAGVVVGALLALGPREDFCEGFEDGWESVVGSAYSAPFCPFMPHDAHDAPYRVGMREGVKAACRRHPERCR